MSITKFAFPTTIHFGAGARSLVAPHLLEQGLKRPLIVTDRALAALPVLAEFKGQLRDLSVAVFDGIHGNPTCAMVILTGDLPIGVDRNSVDTWVYPNLFRMNTSTGAPPDYFDKNGQNWGFPTYNWEEMSKDNYGWWRARLTQVLVLNS